MQSSNHATSAHCTQINGKPEVDTTRFVQSRLDAARLSLARRRKRPVLPVYFFFFVVCISVLYFLFSSVPVFSASVFVLFMFSSAN